MNTVAQYEFFKFLYEQQSKRYEQLEARARFYLTILTFYLGAVAVSGKDLLPFLAKSHVTRWIFSGSGVAFVLAIALCVMSARIRIYEGVADPERLIRSSGEREVKDSSFYENRIIDFAVATSKNSKEYDKIAKVLKWVVTFTFVGVGLHLLGFIYFVLRGS
jgi:hypothetical protein